MSLALDYYSFETEACKGYLQNEGVNHLQDLLSAAYFDFYSVSFKSYLYEKPGN